MIDYLIPKESPVTVLNCFTSKYGLCLDYLRQDSNTDILSSSPPNYFINMIYFVVSFLFYYLVHFSSYQKKIPIRLCIFFFSLSLSVDQLKIPVFILVDCRLVWKSFKHAGLRELGGDICPKNIRL